MDIMAYRRNASTARDMAHGMLEDAIEPPTMEAARRIAGEYILRGVIIEPELLLDIWTGREGR